ncbi:MAG: YbhN family protein [Bacteriovoracia bacterium]
MLKKVLINIIKAGLALGLLGWLVQSGKLNWSLLAEMQRYPLRLLMVFGFCFLNLLLVTWRWRYLLSARSRHSIPLAGLGMVNWIGLFFGSVLPGSITGDVVKIFYVKKSDASLSTPFLLFSSFLDRVMGLTGLILLMGGFSVFNYSTLSALSPKLVPMLHFNFFLLASVITALIVFFLAPHLIEQLLTILKSFVPQSKWPGRLQDLWKDLITARKQMGLAILISIVVQFLGVVIFHLLVSPQYQTALSLELVLSFIPLGFMALAIPIAPGGLGVGHAAFQTLFGFAGEMNGANFFNMYFVVTMVFNILGFIPWLISKRR